MPKLPGSGHNHKPHNIMKDLELGPQPGLSESSRPTLLLNLSLFSFPQADIFLQDFSLFVK